MLNNDFDPYAKLEELFMRDAVLEHNLDQASERLAEACGLMEQMADQIRHLTNAIVGLQNQNKILHHRLTQLEEPHD